MEFAKCKIRTVAGYTLAITPTFDLYTQQRAKEPDFGLILVMLYPLCGSE